MSVLKLGRRQLLLGAAGLAAAPRLERRIAFSEVLLEFVLDSKTMWRTQVSSVGPGVDPCAGEWWRAHRGALAEHWRSVAGWGRAPDLSVNLATADCLESAPSQEGAGLAVTVLVGPAGLPTPDLQSYAASRKTCVLHAEDPREALDALLLPWMSPGYMGWTFDEIMQVLRPGTIGTMACWSGAPRPPSSFAEEVARAEGILVSVRNGKSTTIAEIAEMLEALRVLARPEAEIALWDASDFARPTLFAVAALRGTDTVRS